MKSENGCRTRIIFNFQFSTFNYSKVFISEIMRIFALSNSLKTIHLVKNNNQKLNTMKKYICDICHYEYDPAKGDPDNGIAPGTAFEDLPADWVCPLCGVGKEDFSPAAE